MQRWGLCFYLLYTICPSSACPICHRVLLVRFKDACNVVNTSVRPSVPRYISKTKQDWTLYKSWHRSFCYPIRSSLRRPPGRCWFQLNLMCLNINTVSCSTWRQTTAVVNRVRRSKPVVNKSSPDALTTPLIWRQLNKTQACFFRSGETPVFKPLIYSDTDAVLRVVLTVNTIITLTLYSVKVIIVPHMKLVHWPLMGGLLHFVQRGWDCAGPRPAQALPSCTTYSL